MENKFKKILQIKEKEVDIARINLEKANQDLNKTQLELTLLQEKANEVNLPMSGNVGMIQYTKLLKDSFRNELLKLRHNIGFFESEVHKARTNLNAVQMEFEKFQHLYQIEVKKRLKRLSEQEAKELDEIGNQLFFTQRNKH